MSTIILRALSREGEKVNKVRQKGCIPASLYGEGIKHQAIAILQKDFIKIIGSAGSSQVITLEFEGSPLSVLIHEIQRDPLTREILHLDFYHAKKGEKVSAVIPLVFKGGAPAVKEKGFTLITHVREVEVESLPEQLPSSIEVDLSKLADEGDEITPRDIVLPSGVTMKMKEDFAIISLEAPKKVEEEAKKEEVKEEEKKEGAGSM